MYAVFHDVLSVKEKLITHYKEDGSVDTGKVSDDGKMISWCVPVPNSLNSASTSACQLLCACM